MASNLQIFPSATNLACRSYKTHKVLADLKREVQSWEELTLKTRSDNIANLLHDFISPESDCWRFFYKTLNSLSEYSSELRLKHENYWNAWGAIAGGVLGTEFKGRDTGFSWLIFQPKITEFVKSDWNIRSLIIKAFESVAQYCDQWDDNLEVALNYYYAYCWATISVLRRRIPKPTAQAIGWLFGAWNQVAKKCYDERCRIILVPLPETESEWEKRVFEKTKREVEKTICKIIMNALPLLKIVDKAYELSSEYTQWYLRHWLEMLFDHIFSRENLEGAHSDLIITRKIIDEFENFQGGFSGFVDSIQDPSKKRVFESHLSRSEKVLKILKEKAG